jgi:hypothetical protein
VQMCWLVLLPLAALCMHALLRSGSELLWLCCCGCAVGALPSGSVVYALLKVCAFVLNLNLPGL